MIQVEDCFYLGYVKKTNGVQGGIELALDVDDPGKYKKKESILLLIKDNLTPFFIEQFSIRPKTVFVKLKGVNSANESELLVGTSVYLPLTELPPLKGKNKFYYHEVIGFTAVDINLGKIGIIKDIYDLAAHPVIQIMADKKEVLVPLIDEFLVEVNKTNQEIILNTPEGLVSMYLQND
jgi:16S rRNA processing protein RimM